MHNASFSKKKKKKNAQCKYLNKKKSQIIYDYGEIYVIEFQILDMVLIGLMDIVVEWFVYWLQGCRN